MFQNIWLQPWREKCKDVTEFWSIYFIAYYTMSEVSNRERPWSLSNEKCFWSASPLPSANLCPLNSHIWFETQWQAVWQNVTWICASCAIIIATTHTDVICILKISNRSHIHSNLDVPIRLQSSNSWGFSTLNLLTWIGLSLSDSFNGRTRT